MTAVLQGRLLGEHGQHSGYGIDDRNVLVAEEQPPVTDGSLGRGFEPIQPAASHMDRVVTDHPAVGLTAFAFDQEYR